MEKSNRNIIILGVAATVITVVLTAVSMTIYRKSGDIYLDRSRPGYLPDEEEIEENENEKQFTYSFPDYGDINDGVIDEFLKNLDEVIETLDKYTEPFAPQSISDGVIGIPSEIPSEILENRNDDPETPVNTPVAEPAE